LGQVLIDAILKAELSLERRDVLVVAQKVVSKSEARYVELVDVTPSLRAVEIAKAVEKDPRLVELILSESREVLRYRRGVLIVVHRLGLVMANAGIDQSNVEPCPASERVLLLPKDPDAACADLRRRLEARFKVELAVVINDSVGRAWRNGTVGIALGADGLPSIYDQRGRRDLYGRALAVTQVGFADEIAAAASLLMGQADEGRPLVIVRGLHWDAPSVDATALLRDKALDLFR
jgi:coenzyme F420-0:L-glutamate ligase/coenzyme F420-1:gamma-L-glutamate ligase